MAIPFLNNLDLNKNELQNAVLHVSGTAPGSPTQGQLYYDSTGGDLRAYVYNASNWIPISNSGAQTYITSILNTSLVIGRDADNDIDFATDNQIIFRVGGGDNVIFKASGEIEATSLDISGDIDVDGTTNLDAVDIDGAVQIDNTVTVGVDDTGYDVKFFGDTAGRYVMWDTSQDALLFSDNAWAYFGNDADLRIYHNANDSSYIKNYTNDLYIQNNAADKDIKFYSDDGNGGLFEYFSLDGSEATYAASATTAAYTIFPDKSRIALGAGKNLQIYHKT